MIFLKNTKIGYTQMILEKLTLTLKASSLTFLIGPNGIGKTTFLKTLAGILSPIEGTIEKNCSLAYLTQFSQIQKDITIFEYILLGCEYQGLFPSSVQVNKALEYAYQMDLNPTIRLSYLSGGQLQKVQIAQALFQKSELLLLDEPFSNLDVKNQTDVLIRLQSLVYEGKSVVLTTHDLNLAIRYATEIWIIHDKTIVSVNPYEIEKIKAILDTPLYSYYSSENGLYAWLNY